jgi:hypothetical protein
MLEPTSRELFLSALSPPGGFLLDHAVGTTYSLDLQALLAVPLALTFANCEGADGEPIRDPIALLEALRRLTNRFAIYTQVGGIHVPPIDQRLFAFLEDSVVEVRAPAVHASFHPKVWILRYTDGQGPVLYRVLVLTRNLTFDRCWDAMVVLEGMVGSRKRSDPEPGPLADFVAALPGRAVRPVAQYHREVAMLMADELRTVSIVVPDGVESLTFHSLGLGGPQIDFARRMDRVLVMSPFVTNGFLQTVLRPDTGDILITRPDQAVALARSTVAGVQLLGLTEGADPEPTEDDAAQASSTLPLSGLHAKLIFADVGWKATVWLGSANATTAGHTSNVEFVVEMTGPKSKLGIDAFLGDGVKGGFRSLLTELDPEACVGVLPASEANERQLGLWAAELAAMALYVEVQEIAADEYTLGLVTPGFPQELTTSDCTCRCWPSSLPAARAVPLPLVVGGQTIELPSVSLAALTAFLVIELAPPTDWGLEPTRFAIRVELHGAPIDRPQRVLRSLLATRDDVRRYLLMLLAGTEDPIASLLGPISDGASPGDLGAFTAAGLFERLLSAATRDPLQLQRVARLVKDLHSDDEAGDRLPEGFLPVWDAVWKAAGTKGSR